MITNITIKNIKGFGAPATSIDLELKPKKVNMLYAPNGSGKSSIATAFASLLPRSLKVKKDNMYHKDDALDAELRVTLDGEVLVADKSKNEIGSRIAVHVINAGVMPGTIQHNTGSYTTVAGYLDIEDIELVSKIPDVVVPEYKITDIRKTFGTNGKVLPTLTIFQDEQFWMVVEKYWKLLYTFNSAKSRKKLLEDVRIRINSLKGTASTIVANIPDSWFSALETNAIYAQIVAGFSQFINGVSPFDCFVFVYQLLCFWEKNKTVVRKANQRTRYKLYKQNVDWNLSLLDQTWKQIHSEEKDGKLIVHFPQADEISNGQRDILTFVSEMLKLKAVVKDGKKHLLLIDEVFDYLDDANVIAAQCFLTDLLKEGNDNLYLCVLTHLNPYTFKNYIFSDDKVNHVYLFKSIPAASPQMKAFIAFRQGLNRDDAVQDALYVKLSHDLFHYNPVVIDYSSEIAAISSIPNLRPSWGRTAVLHGVLIDEVNKYLSGATAYDPYAVSLAVRLRIEKIMYEKLPTQILKDVMVNTKETKGKMQFCARAGYEMPDVFNIANAIHNESDHLKYNVSNNTFVEKAMVYKLQNRSIQSLIKKLFDWNGNSLTSAAIN